MAKKMMEDGVMIVPSEDRKCRRGAKKPMVVITFDKVERVGV